jgi:hypothetical protein
MTKPETPERKAKSAFTSISNVLNEVMGRLGLDRRLREQTLLNLWPVIVGDAFASKTRPLFIDNQNILVIAVQDASTAQELSFFKREITNKFKQAGVGTGVNIAGLRFDLKHYHSK